MFDGGTGGGIGCDEIWPEPMPPEGCCQPGGGGGGGATIVGGGSSGLAGNSTIRVVPSCVQKASQSSSKVRLQVGQRFISFVCCQWLAVMCSVRLEIFATPSALDYLFFENPRPTAMAIQ